MLKFGIRLVHLLGIAMFQLWFFFWLGGGYRLSIHIWDWFWTAIHMSFLCFFFALLDALQYLWATKHQMSLKWKVSLWANELAKDRKQKSYCEWMRHQYDDRDDESWDWNLIRYSLLNLVLNMKLFAFHFRMRCFFSMYVYCI